MGMNILLVDDEPAIVTALSPVLQSQGYFITSAPSAASALKTAEMMQFDLVLLDLGLPDADGVEIIGKLKQLCHAVIILSARHQETEKVRALDEGADDYVNKPFGIEELLARIRAAGRRTGIGNAGNAARFASRELLVDFATREVRLLGEDIRLSPKEFALLETLCRHAGQVVTHRKLLIAGWNDPHADSQYLRSYVALLRQKLEYDASEPQLILTEPGVGYRLGATPLTD
ncbi:transcriptional regulator [Erythrobacter sp. SG61-1L]|uniref:response regulator transcription factor n=1 Tax=Erythrobacter sp. SG61-1L TaxID=1603897 RepID=UPI0006C925E6|nr:response regulator transcription factor [Erythrobacter sp. SG61-1L]KPL68315.1 transcriptional regulator [Erythrobacter sp. SG61-1L]